MFICLFVCLLVYMICSFFVLIIVGHPQKVPLKTLWRSKLIWLRYLGSKKCYLFVCVFVFFIVYWFVGFFILIILGHPQEVTLKILWISGRDIKDLKIVYLFVCLFVYLLTILFFILIILELPQEYTLKFCEDPTWFGWDIKD